jgi:hypothetical protein
MLASLCVILAKYGYLPSNYSVTTIHGQLDKLIFDSLENEALLPAVGELNRALGLNPKKIYEDLASDPGPYCDIMQVSLESECKNKGCKNWSKAFCWQCAKLGNPLEELSEDEIYGSVQKFSRSVNLLQDSLEPDFEYIKPAQRCIKCSDKTNLVNYNGFYICKLCSSGNYIQTLGYVIEARVGRPIKEILNYVIRFWQTPQLQSKVLGLSPENFQSLCLLYNVNVKKFRQIGDLRFINPFLSRRKGRPLVDGHLFRLYSTHLKILRSQKLRPEVLKLRNFLLLEANKLLTSRSLPVFDIPMNYGE